MAPLTMMVFPKNSGFHIGEMSVSGMYGPSMPSKKAREAG